jgi:hypothetical protein
MVSGRGKAKNFQNNLPQWHPIHHKSQMDYLGLNLDLRPAKLAINRLWLDTQSLHSSLSVTNSPCHHRTGNLNVCTGLKTISPMPPWSSFYCSSCTCSFSYIISCYIRSPSFISWSSHLTLHLLPSTDSTSDFPDYTAIFRIIFPYLYNILVCSERQALEVGLPQSSRGS